ncbi:hypothetical protein BVC80_1779g31 [Macleaya cordata]|uniref:Uncharacterized protein n=1 Tax=Macleaya cordata TaxID=56857 RepID=A0A200QP74_MACCD|nr:hypothetical protein BVC80_1779g31 [Macleaya cordata]
MEPANIDWKNIKSIYIEDELFEHINAPKWIDFTAPEDKVDDEAWFCRPDCRHPKTAEDFLRSFSNSKVLILEKKQNLYFLSLFTKYSVLVRDYGYLKRRVHNDQRPPESHEDSENQNPNLSTPPNHKINPMKAAIKSSTEKKKKNPTTNSPADSSQERRKPQLRSTLSARNLFSGREILSQITEFCNELKKLATRAKEREDLEKPNGKKKIPVNEKRNPFQEISVKTTSVDLNERENEKEKKPLLAEKENCEAVDNSNGKERLRRKKRNEETENIQISVDVKKVVRENLLHVRTCPPSPQCFSASRPLRPTKAATPLKTIKSMPTERGILQEVEQNNRVLTNESGGDDKVCNKNIPLTTTPTGTEEARTLDIFWFLKPCTMSS